MDIEMIQLKSGFDRPERMEPDLLAVQKYEPRVVRIERISEALSCTLRIETPNSLQALAHGLNPKGGKPIEI